MIASLLASLLRLGLASVVGNMLYILLGSELGWTQLNSTQLNSTQCLELSFCKTLDGGNMLCNEHGCDDGKVLPGKYHAC